MNKTIVNTIFYSIGEILPKVINFLLLPILTIYLSPSDYGITAYTSTVMTLLAVIGTLALNSYVLRFYFIHNDDETRMKVVGTAFVAIVSFNLLILVFAFLLFPSIIENHSIQVAWEPYFKLAIITNFLDCFCTIPLCLYRVRKKAHKYVILNFTRTTLTIALNLLFIVYLKKGVAGYYYAHLLALIPFVPVYMIIIAKASGFFFSWSFLKEGLKFSLPLVPGAIAFYLINTFDRVILERNVDISQIGLYNIAATVVSALAIVVQSGYHAFEPELYSRHGTSEYDLFVHKVQVVFYSSIFLAGMMLTLFSQEALYFFTTEKFHVAYMFIPILMVKAVISGQNVVYSAVLQGDRKSKTEGVITMIGASVSLVLNIILIPHFGVWGAATVGAISLFIMNFLEYKTMNLEGKSIYREVVLTLLIVAIAYIVFWLFPDVSWWGIAIKISACILYCMIICWMYRLSLYDVRHFFNSVKR